MDRDLSEEGKRMISADISAKCLVFGRGLYPVYFNIFHVRSSEHGGVRGPGRRKGDHESPQNGIKKPFSEIPKKGFEKIPQRPIFPPRYQGRKPESSIFIDL